jgi:hypothetical protein
MTYTVEKGVPLPQPKGRGISRDAHYPFKQMAHGDSFAISVPADATKDQIAKIVSNVRSAAGTWRYRNDPENKCGFAVRAVTHPDSGKAYEVRVWKTAYNPPPARSAKRVGSNNDDMFLA